MLVQLSFSTIDEYISVYMQCVIVLSSRVLSCFPLFPFAAAAVLLVTTLRRESTSCAPGAAGGRGVAVAAV